MHAPSTSLDLSPGLLARALEDLRRRFPPARPQEPDQVRLGFWRYLFQHQLEGEFTVREAC